MKKAELKAAICEAITLADELQKEGKLGLTTNDVLKIAMALFIEDCRNSKNGGNGSGNTGGGGNGKDSKSSEFTPPTIGQIGFLKKHCSDVSLTGLSKARASAIISETLNSWSYRR